MCSITLGGLIAKVHDERRGSEGDSSRAHGLVEREVCAGSTRDDETRAVSRSETQSVEVHVRPTALLQLDLHGRVVAVSTNTGCAPRVADEAYYVLPGGELTPAPASAIGRRRWRGDFTTSGVFVQQLGHFPQRLP